MTTPELILEFRRLHAAANAPQPHPEPLRATNADVAEKRLPITMYETEFTYRNDVLVEGHVRPITITRYGIMHEWGATAPSISFRGHDGSMACGSPDLFYVTKEAAQCEVDNQLAYVQKEKAKQDLAVLVIESLPQILDAAEAK